MEIQIGSVVRSKAGRDKGGLFIVIARDGEFAYLADGDRRRAESPKKKKLKHLQVSGKIAETVKNSIAAGDEVTNSQVRKALAEIGG